MTFHKYKKIWRLGYEDVKDIFLQPEDKIIIQEKIDGANFRFMIKDGDIIFGSRGQELTEDKEHKYAKNFQRCIEFVRDTLLGVEISKFNNCIFYGECCLSGDTIIRKTGGGPLGNEMTLREMYNYQEGNHERISCYYKKKDETITTNKTKRNWWKKEGYPNIYSLNIDRDVICPNKIKEITYTGDKEVYEIITRKGMKIKSTKDHRFWTPIGWKKIEELKENDCVGIVRFDVNILKKRNLGNEHKKYKKLVKKLKEDYNCKNCGNNTSLEVHHKDENPYNNDIENLVVLCSECHKRLKHKKNISNSKKREKEYEFDKIISIKYTGIEDCYDITMIGEENTASFVANNFIVHNCVKHSLTYDWEKIPPYLGFDIYNLELEEYVSYEQVKEMFEMANLPMVPLIWEGKVSELNKFIKDCKNGK